MEDIWLYYILPHVNDVWTFRGLYLTCTQFKDYYDHQKDIKKRFNNHLLNIMNEFLTSDNCHEWDKHALYKNPNFPISHIDLIFNHNDYDKTDMFYLSQNPNLTPEYILNNLHLKWNWSYLSSNISMTIDFISNNPDLPWNRWGLSCNPNITLQFVFDDLDKTDQWDTLINIDNRITKKFLHDHITYVNEWSWCNLTRNIDNEIIFENPDLPWNWNVLSTVRRFICYEDLINDPTLIKQKIQTERHEKTQISYRSKFDNKKFIDPNITFNDLIPFRPHLSSYYVEKLSRNKGLTFDMVHYNPNWKWDWKAISYNIFQ